MGTFITGNTPLPTARTDAHTPTSNTAELDASYVNGAWNASSDIRDQVTGWVNPKSTAYGALMDGAADDAPALALAAAAAVANGQGLYIPGRMRIASGSTTVTAPMQFAGGGSLDLVTGGTLTVNCPVLASVTQQIFYLNGGTLTLGAKTSQVSVRWFGATGDGSTDDTTPLRNSVTSAAAHVYCPKGTYKTTGKVTCSTSNQTIFGDGWATIIKASANSYHVFDWQGAVTGIQLRDLQIQGAATTNTTVQFGVFTDTNNTVPTKCVIENVYFNGPSAGTGLNNGIKIDTQSAAAWRITGCSFERLIGKDATVGNGYGVLLGAANDNTISNCRFLGTSGNGRHAVYTSAGSSDNLIIGNTVKDYNEDAFPIYARSTQPACQYNLVIGNVVINGGTAATADAGAITCNGKVNNNSIIGNLIRGFANNGINVSASDAGALCTDNRVIANTVERVSYHGIQAQGSKRTIIQGNVVYQASQDSAGTYNGITIRSDGSFGTETCVDTVVLANTSTGGDQRNAIEVNVSGAAPTGTTIQHNVTAAGTVSAINTNTATVVTDSLAEIAISGATPSTGPGVRFYLTQSGATDITNFTGTYEGKRITMRTGDGNSTFKNTNLYTKGGVDYTAPARTEIVWEYVGGAWREISRSEN